MSSLFLAAAAALTVQAAAPSFYVTLTTSNSPPVNELLLVTTQPFGLLQISTNSPGAEALDFSPDGMLYGAAGDVLSIIDPSTAAASYAATLSAAGAGAALAFGTDGTLYLSDGYTLYTANPANGVCAPVNPFHTNAGPAKLTMPIYGLAVAPNGTLFGGDLNLCTINPGTAAATPIGPICAYPWFVQARDMAFGADGNLYMIGQDFLGDTGLYSVDTNNAAVTPLGSFPGKAFGLVTCLSPAVLGFLTQPASQTILPGDTASFSVKPAGIPTPRASWYFDGAPYPSATNQATTFTLAIANARAANAGSYYVVLTNSTGAVTSDVVELTVTNNLTGTNFTFLASSGDTGVFPNSILSASTNPANETVLGALGTSLACLAFDTNGILYAADDTTLYQVDTNSWGLITMGPVETASSPVPMALSGMAFSSRDVLYGVSGNALFTIKVTNNTALATIVGAFPNNYIISSIAFGPRDIMYGGFYDFFTITPQSAAASYIGPIEGSPAEFPGDMKVGADGYVYFAGGTDLALYRLNPLTARSTRVAAYDSVLMGLAFYPAPFDSALPFIDSPQTNAVAALGETITLSAGVTGGGLLTYQWRNASAIIQDGSRVAGSATSSLTLSNVMPSDAGTYTLVVSNLFGSTSSNVATLAVGAGPAVTVQPAALTRIVEGRDLSLKVTATAGKTASPLAYQWMAGNAIVAGATNRTLTVTANPLNGVTNLFYTVFISNGFGVALSAPAQVVVLPNTARPTVAVRVPAAHARTNSNLIAGTFSGSVVAVLCWATNINNGVTNTSGPFSAALANGGWSAAPWLWPGTNILAVVSSNRYGDVSAVVSRPFFYKVPASLTLAAVGGSGTFSATASVAGDTLPANGAALNIGEGYSLQAKPAADSLFADWTGSIATNAPTIHFIMEEDFSLIGNFTTNSCFGMSGVYDGLFPQTNAITPVSAGLISGLTLTNTGVFSGSLVLAGTSHPLAGKFGADGQASNYIAKVDGGLAVLLNLVTNTYPLQIRGLVKAPNWQSDILLIAKAAGPLPSSAYAMILPPAPNFSGGYGYALITNHAGAVSLAGRLADGAAFDFTSAISESNTVPVYAALYGNTGILTGWLSYETNSIEGQLTWMRPAMLREALYGGGFSNIVDAQSSIWAAPSRGVAALPFTAGAPGLLQISGGNLANPLEFLITVGPNNVLASLPSSSSAETLTGTITAKTGLLTVTFGTGNGKATITGTGAVLQNTTSAFGAFLGTTNSGSISLMPQSPN